MKPDYDKLNVYKTALAVLATSNRTGWKGRYLAINETHRFRRFVWIRWVEQQASLPTGPQWCKELVTLVVTMQIKGARQ